jgi:hypothetical protein
VTAVQPRTGVKFQLIANARKIGINRAGFDMMAHEYSIKTEGVRGGINGEIM